MVENVTLSFRESAVLSDVEIKRVPDAKKKDKKEKKDKAKKLAASEGREKEGIKGDKSPQSSGSGIVKDDSKVMLKGRWRRLNRPPSPPPGESLASLLPPILTSGAASPPQVEPLMRASKELVHQELRSNFFEGKASLRHVRPAGALLKLSLTYLSFQSRW